jgi:hypothetical protein
MDLKTSPVANTHGSAVVLKAWAQSEVSTIDGGESNTAGGRPTVGFASWVGGGSENLAEGQASS